jgi:hypothetical protein
MITVSFCGQLPFFVLGGGDDRMKGVAAQGSILLVAGILLAAGCSSSQSLENGGATSSSSTAARTVVYEVPGMHWAVGWGAKAQEALSGLPGVAKNGVNVKVEKVNGKDNGTVTCQVDDNFDADKGLVLLQESWPTAKVKR